MAKAYQLGAKFFSTKKALREHFKQMLSKYAQGLSPVTDLQDIADLHNLLELHCDFFAKTQGLSNFNWDYCVDASPDYPQTRCFYIFKDGTKQKDFSYIDFEGRTSWADFRNACRFCIDKSVVHPIKERIHEAQNLQNPVEQYELVHTNPKFSEFVKQFIEHESLNVDGLEGCLLANDDANINAPRLLGDLPEKIRQFHADTYTNDSQFEMRETS